MWPQQVPNHFINQIQNDNPQQNQNWALQQMALLSQNNQMNNFGLAVPNMTNFCYGNNNLLSGLINQQNAIRLQNHNMPQTSSIQPNSPLIQPQITPFQFPDPQNDIISAKIKSELAIQLGLKPESLGKKDSESNDIINRQKLLPQESSIWIETSCGKRKRSYAHIIDPIDRRRVRNREVAKNSRDQKKVYVSQLEKTIGALKQENVDLEVENNNLRNQFHALIVASKMDEKELSVLLGNNYMDLVQRERFESGIGGNDDPQIVKSSICIQNDLNGNINRVTSYNCDSQSIVTINKQEM